jgi:hypothetical protein
VKVFYHFLARRALIAKVDSADQSARQGDVIYTFAKLSVLTGVIRCVMFRDVEIIVIDLRYKMVTCKIGCFNAFYMVSVLRERGT